MRRWGGMTILAALASHAGADLVINEIDYDQPGTDIAEFIEIKNTGPSAIDLQDYMLELVNGSDDSIYNTISLPAVNLTAEDYFVICGNAANVPNCNLDASPDSNLIQNGAPDAVGLRNTVSGVLVDTVSYEGSTAGYTETSGEGLVDNPAHTDHGLSRVPDATDTDDNSADFKFVTISPGAINNIPSDGVILLDGFEGS